MGFLKYLIIILLFAQTALGATYYVSPTGSTAWPNCTTSGSPCLADETETGKAFLAAVAGDTVYFLPGTYDPGDSPGWPTPAWGPTNSGSDEDHRIIFQCLTPLSCTLIHNTVGPSIGVKEKNYITWDGFTGTKISSQSMIIIYGADFGADHNTIKNCKFTGYDYTGDNNALISVLNSTYSLIQNNYLYIPGGGTGVLMYYTDDAIIEKNTVIGIAGPPGYASEGIWQKGGGNRCIHRYNFVNGTLIGWEKNTAPSRATCTGNEVYQNVIINTSSAGITTQNHEDWHDLDIKIYNNTLYNIGSTGCAGIGLNYNHDQEVWNNIVHLNSETNTMCYSSNVNDGKPTYMDYNIYYVKQDFLVRSSQPDEAEYLSLIAWQASGALMDTGNPDTHSYYEDPTFANPGGTLPTNYKSSAAHKNNGRGGAYASVIGAYITGNEQIGYVGPGGSAATIGSGAAITIGSGSAVQIN